MQPGYFPLRILLAWAALEIIEIVLGLIFAQPVGGNALVWQAAANLILAGALGYAAMQSTWRGWRLGFAIGGTAALIALSNAAEGSVYLRGRHDELQSLGRIVLLYAILVPIWGMIFSRGREDSTKEAMQFAERTVAQVFWRFVVADVAYLFIYLVFGMIVFPFLKSYYSTLTLPPFNTILLLQLFLRGPLFIAAILALAALRGTRTFSNAIIVGLIFAVCSGLVPLMQPSSSLPDWVRKFHLVEVVTSNLIWGTMVAWLYRAQARVYAASVRLNATQA